MRLSALVLLIPTPAFAAAPLAWQRDDFGSEQILDGTDGWVTGYAQDPWWGDQGVAVPLTDDFGGTFGDGGAADNWLLRGQPVGQGRFEVALYNEDNDTIGLVFAHDGSDTFYLVGHSSDDAPAPVNGVPGPTLFLVRVDQGAADVLARAQVSLNPADFSEWVVEANDDTVTVTVDGVELIDVSGPLLPPGQAGLYAYDDGWGGAGGDNALFDRIEVRWFDDDDDTVVDDDDNCEQVANPGQEDGDGDGIGDACDEADTDTDTDSDSDTDDDSDTDTDTEEDPYSNEPVTGARDCSCAAMPTGAGWLALLLLPWVRRRR